MHLPSSLGFAFVSEALSMIFMNNPQIYSSRDFLYPQIYVQRIEKEQKKLWVQYLLQSLMSTSSYSPVKKRTWPDLKWFKSNCFLIVTATKSQPISFQIQLLWKHDKVVNLKSNLSTRIWDCISTKINLASKRREGKQIYRATLYPEGF